VHGVVAFRIQQVRGIGLWVLGYRCVRPSTTPAKNHGLTDVGSRATAGKFVDEAQKSRHTEYPRRTISQQMKYPVLAANQHFDFPT